MGGNTREKNQHKKDPLKYTQGKVIKKGPYKSASKKDTHHKKHTYPLSILWADTMSDFKKLAQGTLNACYDLAHSLFSVLEFFKNETQQMTESLRKQLLFYLSEILGNLAQLYKTSADKQAVSSLQQEVKNKIESSDVLYYLPENCQKAHNIAHMENENRIKKVGSVLGTLDPVVGRLDSEDAPNLNALKGLHSDEHLNNLNKIATGDKNVYGEYLGKLNEYGNSLKHPNININDIVYTKNTPTAIKATLGAANAAVQRTLENLEQNQHQGEKLFCVVRPPSHHAHHEHAEGFCHSSTLVYAAKQLMDQGKRVLIVDFDVHHGNGTCEQLKRLHRDGYANGYHFVDVFAKESYIDKVPSKAASGFQNNMNFYPMNNGYTGDDLLKNIQAGIAAMKGREGGFTPDVVLVSAGFDSVKEDNFGGALSPQDYGPVGAALAQACPHMISFLEGGYDLTKLPESVRHYMVGTGGLAHQPAPQNVKEGLTFLYNTLNPMIPRDEKATARAIVQNNK